MAAATTATTATTATMAPMPWTYIVEHMEEDYGDWCHLEYIHMIEGVRGSGHRVRFTNLPDEAAAKLRTAAPEAETTAVSVHALGLDVGGDAVRALPPPSRPRTGLTRPGPAPRRGGRPGTSGPKRQRERTCLLDPRAEQELTPADAGRWDTFVFGGILGDDPPKYRTGELHPLGAASRHLGPAQMTTDTAVLVTHAVVAHGRPLGSLPYVDRPDVVLGPHESVNLPFRYLAVAGPGPSDAPVPELPRGMLDHLRDSMDLPL